ncbi:MAG TPA: phosphopentomutase [Clostridia bacterium]|nr:phosphopentomutase [Clostridia bacterium]
MKRVLLIVMDGVGIGWAPDAGRYGDEGSNTLGHIASEIGVLNLPNFEALGLGDLLDSSFGLGQTTSRAVTESTSYRLFASLCPRFWATARLRKSSPGKDSMTGHWELAGLEVDFEFKTFPQGFPQEVIGEFERRIGRKVLGNVPASGTEIIERLGREHISTGSPIVYTSQDSVFQIAAHKDVIALDELYRISEIAREILVGPYLVGRVIARPFVGAPGAFRRTPERRDFSVKPPGRTVLDLAKESGLNVWGIGKIEDLFAGEGLTESFHTAGNHEGIELCKRFLKEGKEGLAACNLVDFDTLYGHRNDVQGFYRALVEFDDAISKIISLLGNDDLLLITADHGCDPTFPGTDHTREDVPLLVYGSPKPPPGPPKREGKCEEGDYKPQKAPTMLGLRKMADVGATIAEFFGLGPTAFGKPFLKEASKNPT